MILRLLFQWPNNSLFLTGTKQRDSTIPLAPRLSAIVSCSEIISLFFSIFAWPVEVPKSCINNVGARLSVCAIPLELIEWEKCFIMNSSKSRELLSNDHHHPHIQYPSSIPDVSFVWQISLLICSGIVHGPQWHTKQYKWGNPVCWCGSIWSVILLSTSPWAQRSTTISHLIEVYSLSAAILLRCCIVMVLLTYMELVKTRFMQRSAIQ